MLKTGTSNSKKTSAKIAQQYLLLPAAAGVLGCLAFQDTTPWLLLVCALPIIYSSSNSRPVATLSMLAYHLAASRGLAAGSAAYFHGSLSLGVLIWAAGNLLNAGVYGLLWSRNPNIRPISFMGAMLLLSLPPFGILGWASPLTVSGVLYPGLKWVGLFLTLFLLYFIPAHRRHPIKLALLLLISVFSSYAYVPRHEPRWHAINTNFGAPVSDPAAEYRRYLALAAIIQHAGSINLVLPESTSPDWNEASINLWRKLVANGGTIALGSEIGSARQKTQVIGFAGERTVRRYLQRQPIPLSMWRPWASDGYGVHWFANPVIEMDGHRISPMICFETFLVWPVLSSRFHGAEEIVATANLWWAKGTSIPGIQGSIITAWAMLFDMPFALAVNT